MHMSVGHIFNLMIYSMILLRDNYVLGPRDSTMNKTYPCSYVPYRLCGGWSHDQKQQQNIFGTLNGVWCGSGWSAEEYGASESGK